MIYAISRISIIKSWNFSLKGRLKGHSRNYLPVELMGADSSLNQEIMTKIVDYDIGRKILIGAPLK